MWKRKATPVPKFGPVENPQHPTIFEAYGTANATPGLVHTFTIKRLAVGVQANVRPGKILARYILAEERRWEDKRHWERLLEGPPTHAIQLTYEIKSEANGHPREVIHCWVGLSLPGWSSDAIAIECGNFVVFSLNEMKLPAVLTTRNVGSASTILVFFYTRYRAILVKAGYATERSRLPDVTGYRLTGDR